jgi:pimeloyl-ACP methyl ester carboxylesterase
MGASSGCASSRPNASFDVSTSEAQKLLTDMRREPKPLQRPLVVLGGFCDPGIATSHLTGEFRRLTGDDRVMGVSFLMCGDFDACRKQVIKAVDKAFPSDDPRWTTEVDVIGVSMGGLVGRYAAARDPHAPQGRRLKVARLFTIGTPHRGASLAIWPTLHSLQIDMRANSRFLRSLERREAAARRQEGFEVYPYVRLGDVIVGVENAAPFGQDPMWVPGEPFQDSHMMAMMDARIIADITRRLRGEPPLASEARQPLPSEQVTEPATPDDRRALGDPAHGTTFARR